jgi:hypothetical protein
MNFIVAWLKHIWPTLLLLLAVFTLGYWAGKGDRPHAIDQVVRVINPPAKMPGLELPPRTFRPPPRIIIAERTVTETRVDTIRVPVVFDRYRLIGDNYIHAGRRSVWIRSYNPQTSQFEVDRITIPRPSWSTSLYAQASYDLLESQPGIGLTAELRYRSLATGATAALQLDAMKPQIGVWMRYYLW